MSKSILSNGISTIDTEQETKSRSSHCTLTLVWRVIIVTVGAIYLTMNLYEMYVAKQEIRQLKSLVRELQVARQQDLFEWSWQASQSRKKRAALASTQRIARSNENGNGNFGGNANTNGLSTSGSTFTRWGRKSCPQGTGVVYSGYAAGAEAIVGSGGSSRLECLPQNPAFYSNSASSSASSTLITAAKFSLGDNAGIFSDVTNNSVISCAVCVTSRAPTLMIPGWDSCPFSWTRVYYGYLMSTPGIASEYYQSAENYCVDKQPEVYTGHSDSHGAKLTFVQAGSCNQNQSPCSRYTENSKLSCTVCSKLTAIDLNNG